jgi:hypothetical protein
MIQDLLGAVASTQAYRRFAAEKAGRTVLYICFLSLLFTVFGSIAMKLRVGPAIDQTFEWLEKDVPTLTFEKGKVSAASPEPKRIAHPAAPEVAVMIDTARTTPVTAQDLKDQKVLAYLTNSALYIEERPGEIRSYDLGKAAADKPVVVDAKFFRDASSAVKTVVYPLAIVTVFVFAGLWTAFAGLFFALLGMLFGSIAGATLTFGSLYQIAIHAQTASLLVRVVMAFLPFFIPMSGLLTFLITAVYLWLGVRAVAQGAQAVSDA